MTLYLIDAHGLKGHPTQASTGFDPVANPRMCTHNQCLLHYSAQLAVADCSVGGDSSSAINRGGTNGVHEMMYLGRLAGNIQAAHRGMMSW